MDLHQLKTFVVVAREGSVTRASKLLHLSQPAVSAHIKAIEEAFDLALFERTAKGMSLTPDGQRLLAKAEQALAAHHDLIAEATRLKGELTGRLRIGAASNSGNEAVGRLLVTLSERFPAVEVALEHGTSREILAGVRSGRLDAGFYNEAGAPEPDLATVEVSRFDTFLVGAPGLVPATDPLDWRALAEVPWVYPTASACCGRTAEGMFEAHRIRPKRVLDVDRESMIRTLIASGLGVGLLHEDGAEQARSRGEVVLLARAPSQVRVLFAHLASRTEDPLVGAATDIARAR